MINIFLKGKRIKKNKIWWKNILSFIINNLMEIKDKLKIYFYKNLKRIFNNLYTKEEKSNNHKRYNNHNYGSDFDLFLCLLIGINFTE
jgi:hypothetical protein